MNLPEPAYPILSRDLCWAREHGELRESDHLAGLPLAGHEACCPNGSGFPLSHPDVSPLSRAHKFTPSVAIWEMTATRKRQEFLHFMHCLSGQRNEKSRGMQREGSQGGKGGRGVCVPPPPTFNEVVLMHQGEQQEQTSHPLIFTCYLVDQKSERAWWMERRRQKQDGPRRLRNTPSARIRNVLVVMFWCYRNERRSSSKRLQSFARVEM